MPYCFLGPSIKFQGHMDWKIDDLNPIWVRLLGRSQLSNPSDLPRYSQGGEPVTYRGFFFITFQWWWWNFFFCHLKFCTTKWSLLLRVPTVQPLLQLQKMLLSHFYNPVCSKSLFPSHLKYYKKSAKWAPFRSFMTVILLFNFYIRFCYSERQTPRFFIQAFLCPFFFCFFFILFLIYKEFVLSVNFILKAPHITRLKGYWSSCLMTTSKQACNFRNKNRSIKFLMMIDNFRIHIFSYCFIPNHYWH